jgi:hypothetical protein
LAAASLTLSACSLLLDWSNRSEPCGPGDSCLDGFTCASNKCIPAPDAGKPDAGSRGCPADASFDTDSHNCGACAHDCLGGPCLSSQCQPLQMTATAGSLRLAQNATQLFWGTQGGDILRLSKAGDGGAPFLVATSDSPNGIADVGGNLYWGSDSGVYTVPEDAGGATPAPGPIKFVADLVTDGRTLFYRDGTDTFYDFVPNGGANTPACLVTGGVQGMAADSLFIYWADVSGDVRAVQGAGSCANPNILLTGDGAVSLFANAHGVFLGTGTSIQQFPPWNGVAVPVTATTLVQGLTEPPGRLFADTDGVYWTEPDGGRIRWKPFDGGSELTFGGRDLPVDIVADPRAVYWTEQGAAGGVFRLAK